MKTDIVAIGAHPDDVEISACGTLSRQAKLGHTIGIIDLTRGELGTRGSVVERNKEAKKAAEMMGLKFRSNLNLKDGFFEVNEEAKLKLVEKIRKHQPKTVLIPAPVDRHPDHGRAAVLCRDACFLAGLSKIKTTSAPWRPASVFHYVQDWYLQPTFVVDISDFAERKIEILKAYKSQFFDPRSTAPVTPISREDFFDFLRGRWAQFGRMIGVRYAEGFISERPIGVGNIQDIF